MKKVIFALTLILTIALCWAAEPPAHNDRTAILRLAEEHKKALLEKDHEKAVSLLHPDMVKAAGGKHKLIQTLREEDAKNQAAGFVIESMELALSGPIYTGTAFKVGFVTSTMVSKSHQIRMRHKSFFVAFSPLRPQQWYMLDGTKLTDEQFRKIFPGLPDHVKLPEVQRQILSASDPTVALSSDAEAIAKSLEEYRSVILKQRGEEAVVLVSKAMVDEYQHYVDWAVAADRKTLESLSFFDRFQVLLMKHRIPSETLKRLDGRSAFVYAVDRGWVGKDEVIGTTLGQIDIARNLATAEVLIRGQKAPVKFQFSKENGKWKLDLLETMRAADQVLKAVAKERGISENELIFSLIETASGRKVENTIWTPIQKRAD